jgi:adenine nucleotide transporter 17
MTATTDAPETTPSTAVDTTMTSSPAVTTAMAAAIPPNDNVAHALAGAGGGILSMILTYPLITLSTRAQVESRRASSAFSAAVQNIVAREGVAGLYAGLSSALFGISVTNFVYYYWYEWTKAFLENRALHAGGRRRKLSTLETMLAGALAGSATVIITNPIWVVNTRMTTGRRGGVVVQQPPPEKPSSSAQGESASPAAAVADKLDGSSADTKGTTTTATHEQQPGINETGTQVVNPTALNDASPQKTTTPAPTHRSGTIATLLALLRHEGPQALFAGVLPALILVANPILQYTLFEQLKNAVERRRRRDISPALAFVLGALGKLFATTITYPYITVKSQMHVAAADAGTGKRRGVLASLREMVREEGYAGLYKGLGPKLAQSVLTAAFLFAFKDVLYAQTVKLRMKAAARKLAA